MTHGATRAEEAPVRTPAARWWRRFVATPEPNLEPPTDLARRLARVQLAATRRIAAPWAGAYRSAFRGVGLEFAGVREYAPGDDSRTVDWRVTARTGRLTVRRYVEERDRHVLFVVDVSAATEAGSGERTLRDVAAEVVALAGTAAQSAGDRVGLLAWSDRRERLLVPSRRPGALLRIVHAVLANPPRAVTADLDGALADARRVLRRRSVVVLISPFAGPSPARGLLATRARHELLAVRLLDPLAARGASSGRAPAVAAPSRGYPASEREREIAGLVPGTPVTVTPESNTAAVLAAAFERRGRSRHG